MRIVELLKESKKLYLENQGKAGMCWCIKVIANKDKSRIEQSNKGHVPYNVIVAQIPEFNPYFLEASIVTNKLFKSNVQFEIGLEFWWHIEDTGSRRRAFDKLIELYKDSDKEFIW